MTLRLFLVFFSALLLAGCGDDRIQTVQVAKEQVAPSVDIAPSGPGFDAELPDGWMEKPGSGIRVVSYSIEGSSIDFYLISLRMGDVPSNVNRWRSQVGLDPVSPEEIARDVQAFQVDGHDVKFIEIYNGESGRGVVAAIVDLAPEYGYFTAKGPVPELKAHVGDIRKFIQSLEI